MRERWNSVPKALNRFHYETLNINLVNYYTESCSPDVISEANYDSCNHKHVESLNKMMHGCAARLLHCCVSKFQWHQNKKHTLIISCVTSAETFDMRQRLGQKPIIQAVQGWQMLSFVYTVQCPNSYKMNEYTNG